MDLLLGHARSFSGAMLAVGRLPRYGCRATAAAGWKEKSRTATLITPKDVKLPGSVSRFRQGAESLSGVGYGI
jgi:hypothetical protein